MKGVKHINKRCNKDQINLDLTLNKPSVLLNDI